MKLALLGDTHFGARNDSPAFHKLFARFYDEVFFPYLEKENILHVIQLGDVFDRRKYINFQTLKSSREYFFDRLNRDYTSWLFVGNHDTYYKNTNDVNSPELLLGEYHNIKTVNTPTEVDFEDVKFLMIPWWCEANSDEINKHISSTKANVIAGHLELDGFEMHSGVSHQGGTSPKIFENFEMVVSGHFHHKSTHGNINYLGTPYEMTWSDFNDPKGFHVYDTETRELTFVENPIRMFHKIHYDDMDKQTSDVLNVDFSVFKETYVKLIVRNKTNPYTFDLFVTKLEEAGVYNVQVVEDHLNLDTETDDEIVQQAEDTLSLLTKYVKQMDDSIDKPRLDTLMRSLYQEALSVESLNVE